MILEGRPGIPGQDGVSEDIERFERGYQGRRKSLRATTKEITIIV